MLSQKLLVDVGVDTFAGKNAIGGVNSPLIPLESLLSASWPSHLVQAVISEIFHLKDNAPTGAGAREDLCERSVPRKAFISFIRLFTFFTFKVYSLLSLSADV
jgi:hypothetical protein